jgi:hypothetical protein
MALHGHSPEIISTVAGAAVVSGLFIWWWKTRKHATDEERERLRREYLTETGRIIDGTLVGIDDLEGDHARHHDGPRILYYSYEISGVFYESSQDVRHLQQFIHPDQRRLASAVSVRYDPRNHANSIVVAESWTGLRKRPPRRTGQDHFNDFIQEDLPNQHPH